jgi:cytochrome c553
MQLPSTTLLETTMGNSIKWLAAGVLCAAAFGAQAQVNQIKVWAAACANCHGTNGRAEPGMESLAGKDKDEMLQKLMDFKSGRKPATIMHQLSKGYTDEQLAQITGYFAAQKK